MYKKKYEKGIRIRDMEQLAYAISKGEWIYLRHKAYHPGWVESLTFRTLSLYVKNGHAHIAKRTEEE